MRKDYGKTARGKLITDELIAELVARAENGFSVEKASVTGPPDQGRTKEALALDQDDDYDS